MIAVPIRKILARLAILATLFSALPAAAALADQSASDWISNLGDRVVGVLRVTENDMDRRKTELENIFLESFDVDFIARFVIGRFWRKATPEQQAEFMEILPDYVATIYAALFSGYDGDGFKVTDSGETAEGVVISGVIQRNDGPDVVASFVVSKPDGKYLIQNATVEGVSLLVTKRAEFSSVLVREGMDGLIGRIRKILQS